MKHPIKISLYWMPGHRLVAAFWAFTAWLDGDFILWLGLLHFALDVAIGIGITQAYRRFAIRHNWINLVLRQLAWRIIASSLVCGLLYMGVEAVKLYVLHILLAPVATSGFTAFLQANLVVLTMTGIRLMAIWVLAYHLYHFALLQIRAARENARLLLSVKDAELSHLSAQLNPHFFFNSLNSIKALAASDPEQARRAIDLLSALLRTALYPTDGLLIPLRDELDLVSDYLELEKIRFEDRLFFDRAIDDSLLLACRL